VNHHGTPDYVKLLDFGIAFQLPEGDDDEAKRITSESFVMGTPLYMAPEQARGHIDSRSDIYALGVILYEMVTGKVPFNGSSSADILVKHLTQKPAPPTLYAPEIPAVLEEAILKAMSKKVEERYQTIEKFLAALEAAETVVNADKTQPDLARHPPKESPSKKRNLPDTAKTLENPKIKPIPLPILVIGAFCITLLLTYLVITKL
jgi:serine/threonine protein kinase